MPSRDHARTEADLRASEARYQALVEHLPVVVYVDSDDPEPWTLYVSPNVEQVLGYPVEHYLRANAPAAAWGDLLHEDDRARVLSAWRLAVDASTPFDMDYRFRRPDGGVVWVHDHSALVRDVHGRRLYWQGILVDVTARVAAEKELAASDARRRALVENIPAVVYEMGPDDERRAVYVSGAVEELLGYTREEWLEQPDIWPELLHPDDREIELDAHDHHTATGEPWSREYRLIASDGRVVWVRDQATLVRDEDGHAITWQGVMFDVTAQKEADELLRLTNDELEGRVRARTTELAEANELLELEVGERRRAERAAFEAREGYRLLVEHMPAVAYVWHITEEAEPKDPRWYVSPRIQDVLGYTPDEWIAEGWDRRLHPHDRDRVLEAAARSEATGEPFEAEFRYFAKDGSVVWVDDRAVLLSRTPEGSPELFQGVMLDITSRKEAERKAEEATERFREFTEQGPGVTFAYQIQAADPSTLRIEYVSPQMALTLGYPLSSWVDTPEVWFDIMHPDDRERVGAVAQHTWVTGEPWEVVYRMIAADGRVVWLEDRGLCIATDDLGRPHRFQGVILDVSERVLRETELHATVGELRGLLEGVPAVTWAETIDPETGHERYVYISPQVVDLLGYTPEELMAEPAHFPRLVHPDDLPRVEAVSKLADHTGQWADTYRVLHRDGSIRWVHGRGRRVTPPEVRPELWRGITIDVTDTWALWEDTSTPPAQQAAEPFAP
jgi:PAS domain S-box-containing protein